MQSKDDTALTVAGITARVRRGPVGVMLALGPFNYPVFPFPFFIFLSLLIYFINYLLF
jgi:acyl-CoA reductase-like NAD-dependent aldehyde dehydrogenase